VTGVLDKVNYCLTLSQGIDEYLQRNCSPSTPIESKLHGDTVREDWEKHFASGRISFVPTFNMMTDAVEVKPEKYF
jgi:hypothetical protein